MRRSEVAALADVSVEYYAKLERGNLAGVSPAVLEAIARALRLDDAERAHLLHLAQAQPGSDTLARPRRRSDRQRTLHKSLQWTLDAVTAGPAFVVNGRLDVLAANQLARAFFADLYDSDTQPPNLARHQFLDTAARRFPPLGKRPPPLPFGLRPLRRRDRRVCRRRGFVRAGRRTTTWASARGLPTSSPHLSPHTDRRGLTWH